MCVRLGRYTATERLRCRRATGARRVATSPSDVAERPERPFPGLDAEQFIQWQAGLQAVRRDAEQ